MRVDRLSVVVLVAATVMCLSFFAASQDPGPSGPRGVKGGYELQQVLASFVGRKFGHYHIDGLSYLRLDDREEDELVLVGRDFVELRDEESSTYVPLARLELIVPRR